MSASLWKCRRAQVATSFRQILSLKNASLPVAAKREIACSRKPIPRHPGRRRGKASSDITHEVTNVGTDRSKLSHVANEAKETLGTESLDAVADRGYFLFLARLGTRLKPSEFSALRDR
jgi:hypothetical protein